jgi:hypothetical protein
MKLHQHHFDHLGTIPIHDERCEMVARVYVRRERLENGEHGCTAGTVAEAEALARLITVASDLLEVCDKWVNVGHHLSCEWYGGGQCKCGFEQVRALIAQARGEPCPTP